MEALVNPNQKRIQSIDLLRGLIMIIMALDHTRDFFHATAFTEDPLTPATTTPALYFTRWITHFCAPLFVFLSGTSAYLQSLKKSKKELSLFLIKRGIWLVLVEVTLINLVFSFDIYFSQVALTTIWSIGISMVVLGLLIWLPFPLLLIIGLLIVLGHNGLDYYEKANPESKDLFYDMLHRPNFFDLGWIKLLVLYPFLPWAGLMILGYCFGKLINKNRGEEQKKTLLWLGIGTCLFFVLLRAIDIYGDPDTINGTHTPLESLYSFLDTTKYPPSLLFMSMTIGPGLVFMAFFQHSNGRIGQIISVYGRVPFFYYILHFLLIHIISTVFFLARGHSISEGINSDGTPNFIKRGEGVDLWAVYLLWIGILAVLYPACSWYDRYKTNHKEKWWLSYL